MKLFINSGVCERFLDFKVLPEYESKLSFPNITESNGSSETVNFIFSGMKAVNEESLIDDLTLNNISLSKSSKNTYHVSMSNTFSNRYMYALLRSTNAVPDDIYIPKSMASNIKVLRRIRFFDSEVDYGSFLSNVYLIRIFLKSSEFLPIYLTHSNPRLLQEHYVFYKSDFGQKEYKVSGKLSTHIFINKYTKNDFISLSELCK